MLFMNAFYNMYLIFCTSIWVVGNYEWLFLFDLQEVMYLSVILKTCLLKTEHVSLFVPRLHKFEAHALCIVIFCLTFTLIELFTDTWYIHFVGSFTVRLEERQSNYSICVLTILISGLLTRSILKESQKSTFILILI